MKLFRIAVAALICSMVVSLAAEANEIQGSSSSSPSLETIVFRGSSGILHGYLYKPLGKGPFPAVMFFPDARKQLLKSGPATQFNKLAEFWTSNGYVLFIPEHQPRESISRGTNGTPEEREAILDQKLVDQLQLINKDVVAATEWLKAQGFVDDNRIVMTGTMFGASHTIVSAEKEIGVKAFVAISPAILSWNLHPTFQAMLRRGVRNAKAPIFLIQTQNDNNLAPSAILGKELQNKGFPNRTMVYPPFGASKISTQEFALKGCSVWGPDVLKFLREALPQPTEPLASH